MNLAIRQAGRFLVAGAVLLAGSPSIAATVVLPPFDANYQLSSLPAPAGVPARRAGITFPTGGDQNTLLIAGNAFSGNDGPPSIYRVTVSREPVTNRIIGFSGPAVLISTATGLPGSGNGVGLGLAYEPGNVLLYTSPENSLGMILPGASSPAKIVYLSNIPALSTTTAGPLAVVPPGFQGAGKVKLAAYTGQFFQLNLTPDGNGTYDVSSAPSDRSIPGIGTTSHGLTNNATGLVYVAAGNPGFDHQNLLISSCDFNTGMDSYLMAMETDSNGNPILGTPLKVASELCAAGAAVDPMTGDLLFSTVHSGLYVLSGFTVPPGRTGVAISAAPATIRVGQRSKLTWDSTGASTCNSGGSWATTTRPVRGTETLPPATTLGTGNYKLSCQGPGGSSGKTAFVTVLQAGTALTVQPYVGNLVPGTTVNLKFSATLKNVSASPAVGVAGRRVRLYAGNYSCTATTNSQGVAECAFDVSGAVQTVLKDGYRASFTGDSLYLKSSAAGPLVIVNGTKY